MLHPFSYLGVALGVSVFGDVAKTTPPLLDRVVAVIGKEPVTLSSVRQRARPHFVRIDATERDEARRAASKTAVLRDMLERMIDESLEQREADKAQITVTPSEIDNAIRSIIAQAKTTEADLFAEVKRQGMTEAEYKDEIRRQIIEGKLIQIRVRGRVRVTDADARAVYATWLKEQSGPNAPIDLRIVVLRVPRDASTDAKKAVETRAAQIASQAKTGTDFCALVTTHSEDPTTKSTCGSKGPLSKTMLYPEIGKAVDTLKPGDVSAPVWLKDPTGEQAYLVIQRAPGSGGAPPSFENVKDRMMERAMLEATERERKQWLADLRKATYIDLRL